MKFTCLSEGKGYHRPSCHILDVCGFRVLIDCPLDLTALLVFSPIPVDFYDDSVKFDTAKNNGQEVEKQLDAGKLIQAEPWYKTVSTLQLWDISFIDVVLISSPMGMLGLPFLTSKKNFSAKIYATEAAARLGQLMMEELVAIHMEMSQFYGNEESGFPHWMKWEHLDLLPCELQDMVLGKDGIEFAGWMPLYSAADVKDCIKKVQTLKYAEEACYNGMLVIKALSSGLEVGSCNWNLICPKGSIAYVSNSVCASLTAREFDYNALQGCDLLLFSDFTPSCTAEKLEVDDSSCGPASCDCSEVSDDSLKTSATSFLSQNKSAEEIHKIAFLSSCAAESVKARGSVLITIGRPGIVLQLLEQVADSLESLNLKVPIYFVSPVAQELLTFSNIIPEWLGKQRQDRLYSGQPLFKFTELVKQNRLHIYPTIYSSELLTNWQEPCIVFCPHWSLRLGPATHLLRRWCVDQNSLLIVEEGEDASLAFSPFKPLELKILQCSFLSGLSSREVTILLKILRPKNIVLPEKLRTCIGHLRHSYSFGFFHENETFRMAKLKDNSELDIAADLASLLLRESKSIDNDASVARIRGDISMEHGRQRLHMGSEKISQDIEPFMYFGRVDLARLQGEVSKMGLITFVSEGESVLRVLEPSEALVEVTPRQTIVSTPDESLASVLCEAVSSMLISI